MNNIKYMQGDLVTMIDNNIANAELSTTVFAQGCNIFKTQGAGIAAALRKFPQIYAADVKSADENGGENTLGKFSYTMDIAQNVVFFNAYTQTLGLERNLNYEALYRSMNAVIRFCARKNYPLYIPKIGSDLAGGNWNIIECMLNELGIEYGVIVNVLNWKPNVDPRFTV